MPLPTLHGMESSLRLALSHDTAAMSALLVAVGFFGGLVMSAVKRSLGAKDWGQGIPGHGGVLDRLDSLLFAAPVFFHITGYYFGTQMAAAYSQPVWIKRLLEW